MSEDNEEGLGDNFQEKAKTTTILVTKTVFWYQMTSVFLLSEA